MGFCMHIDGVTCDNCRNAYMPVGVWPRELPPAQINIPHPNEVAVKLDKIIELLEKLLKR